MIHANVSLASDGFQTGGTYCAQVPLYYTEHIRFHCQVVDFQPYYVFSDHHKNDLEVGLAIIHETLERELVKQERADRAKREAKEAELEAKEKASHLPPITAAPDLTIAPFLS